MGGGEVTGPKVKGRRLGGYAVFGEGRADIAVVGQGGRPGKGIEADGVSDYGSGVKRAWLMRLVLAGVFVFGGMVLFVEEAGADIVKREMYKNSKGQKVYGWVYEKGRTRFARSPQFSTYWGGGFFRSRVIVRRGHHHHRSHGGRGGISVRW
ncbi:MAG: hypothetical protein AAF591_08375 [Verrucomicrobiota bacterium]